MPAALATAVAGHRLDPQTTVTVGLSTLGQGLAQQIEAVLGGKSRANELYVRQLARIRSAEELEAARKATWIAERGYEHMLKSVHRGMREFELAAELYCAMKKLGAEDNFLLLSASQHNLAVRAAGGRVLDDGDIILSEITPCYQGQFAQICRTTVIGEPSPLMREKYALLQTAMRAGQTAAVPGATAVRGMRGHGRLLPRGRLRRLLPAALHARARPRPRHHVGPARRSHDRERR